MPKTVTANKDAQNKVGTALTGSYDSTNSIEGDHSKRQRETKGLNTPKVMREMEHTRDTGELHQTKETGEAKLNTARTGRDTIKLRQEINRDRDPDSTYTNLPQGRSKQTDRRKDSPDSHRNRAQRADTET